MPKTLEILVLILAPLAWGLLADLAFERLRRRWSPADRADDETIV